MESTLDRNGFLEMFEEQEDNRSSKEKIIAYWSWIKVRFRMEKQKGIFEDE